MNIPPDVLTFEQFKACCSLVRVQYSRITFEQWCAQNGHVIPKNANRIEAMLDLAFLPSTKAQRGKAGGIIARGIEKERLYAQYEANCPVTPQTIHISPESPLYEAHARVAYKRYLRGTGAHVPEVLE